MKTSPLHRLYNRFEAWVQYPYLKEGSIGVQVGFDMSSKNVSSDLFNMAGRVGKTGLAVGVDPDNKNIERATKWIDQRKISNVKLIHCGTYKEKATLRFEIADRSSNNALDVYGALRDQQKRSTMEIEVDTLDHLFEIHQIDLSKVRHINITNNCAEYHTLLGMDRILSEAKDITITLTCGRVIGNQGIIDGRPDQELIMECLDKYGFNTKFYRMGELFAWGVLKKLFVKRTWIYDGKPRYGVVIASKGRQPFRFHHSYMG